MGGGKIKTQTATGKQEIKDNFFVFKENTCMFFLIERLRRLIAFAYM